MRTSWILGGGLAVAVAALAFGTHHARAMLTFTEGGTRTANPETLTAAEVAWVLVRGVTIPRPEHARTPGALGHDFSDHRIPVDGDITLGAWVVPPLEEPGPERVAVLFHGYAAAADQLLPVADRFLAAGYRVVLVDFRGVGRSSESATGLTTTESQDVAAALRWSAEHTGDPAPVVYGFSLGAASVIRALAHEDLPVEHAVVEAGFGRLTTTVGARFEALGLPPLIFDDLLVLCGSLALGTNGFAIAPEVEAARVRAPLTVLHGALDARVSLAEAQAIARAADAALVVTDDLGHRPLADADPAAFDQVLASLRR